jgi:tRNA A37 threonylcarbamoyladenosine biosynthesis protein TsaE
MHSAFHHCARLKRSTQNTQRLQQQAAAAAAAAAAVAVAAPAGRGKTFLCNKLKCYLNW